MATQGSLTPTTFEGVVKFAQTISTSQMVPANFRGKPDDILVAVQWGNEVGLAPMAALQNIAVINGKPSIYGDGMMAIVSAHPAFGGCEETIEEIDGDITAICKVTRVILKKPVVKTFKFSQADAVRAKLWNKPGPWSQYPKRMLQMRARGFALRDAFPDALKGIISKEEADDMPDREIKVINPLDTLQSTKREKLTPINDHTDLIEALDDTQVPEETDTSENGSEESETWSFKLPAFKDEEKEEEAQYPTAKGWCDEFTNQINLMSKDEELSFEERRHNLSIIKEANQNTIDQIKTEHKDLSAVVQKTYVTKIKFLSAKANEANND